MTATAHPQDHTPPDLALPDQPAVRLRVMPRAAIPRRIDGIWWPRSRDLMVELPLLLAALPPSWGHIAAASVHAAMWAPAPDHVLIDDQVVRLHQTRGTYGRHTICLLTPGHGRWDLLVAPPESDRVDAELRMASAVAE
ncbi:DUF5994 family protein [Streptomyces monticola]|uniref:DUF5994 family protein n=1 Tax=Streptomyces monticola TaxID=2666263 RepID=A0ABW2JII5_9ACTN